MNYDGILAALGATPQNVRAKGAHNKYRVHSLNDEEALGRTGGGGATAVKNVDGDERRPDPYMNVFRKAPLPRMNLSADPRVTRRWVVEGEHQPVGVNEEETELVRRCVPYEVLRSITPAKEVKAPPAQLCVDNNNNLQIAIVTSKRGSAELDELRQQWLCKRPKEGSQGQDVGGVVKVRKSRLPNLHPECLGSMSPKSSSPVRIKRRINSSLLLSQHLDDVIAQHSQFASRFASLQPKEQESWRLHWSTRSPQLRSCLDKYLQAGLFSEAVRLREYGELFQRGVFINRNARCS